MRILSFVLLPFSGIYWCITFIRNYMFDKGIIAQTSFSIPIISLGNITVGGTGKTPHSQYLISQLQHTHSLAVLSRGYKRKTKGYVDNTSINIKPENIGDEPYMIHKIFPNCIVAVCENRVEGVKTILKKHPLTNCIILDDAYQHRHIKPGYQILLVDYTRPIWNDYVFPAGRLREGTYAVSRANTIIVTKSPFISNDEKQIWRKKLQLHSNQKLIFSSISYGKPYSIFTKKPADSISSIVENKKVLLVTGLARAEALLQHIKTYSPNIVHFEFPDHYNYTKTDIQNISAYIENKHEWIIITTEKDMHKLLYAGLSETISSYVIPIEPVFNPDDESILDEEIRNYLSQYPIKQ